MMNDSDKISLSIAKDFSRFPAGRFTSQGPATGELFREKFLRPALESGKTVIVNLDDTEGYGSSFLEEAFGGLIRKGYYTHEELQKKLKIEANKLEYTHYIGITLDYIKKAKLEIRRG